MRVAFAGIGGMPAKYGVLLSGLLLINASCTGNMPGIITEFPLPYTNSGCNLGSITTGPNGNLWFAVVPYSTGIWEIDEMTTSGAVTQFSLPPPPNGHFILPGGLTAGLDGNVWFTLPYAIGQITPAGIVSTFPIRDQDNTAGDITTLAPNYSLGNLRALQPDLWFTLTIDNAIGSMSSRGYNFGEFAVPTPNSEPSHIKAGLDGNLWFTEANIFNGHNIGRMTQGGTITEFPVAPPFDPRHAGLTTGPDGRMWYTHGQFVGQITLAGSVTEIPLGTQKFASEIVTGPDANLWFAQDEYGPSNTPGKHAIVMMTTGGTMTPFYPPSQGDPNLFANYYSHLTRGSDGSVWFSEGVGVCKIARITTQRQPCEFSLPTANSFPNGITAGPDGNLWFTEVGTISSKVGRISPQGIISEFPTLTPGSGPMGIVLGPDGNLWFTESFVGKIGRITPAGVTTEYPLTTGKENPRYITKGPDGNVWFTETTGQNIGRITPGGTITEFSISGATPQGITAGPDGNLWFVGDTGPADSVFRMTPSGQMTQFLIPNGVNVLPNAIAVGPNGNLWFTNDAAPTMGQITTSGMFLSFGIPAAIGPSGITSGPGGNLWFTAAAANAVGRMTPSGDYTLFPVLSYAAFPNGITTGPDGNLWFTETNANKIGCIVP